MFKPLVTFHMLILTCFFSPFDQQLPAVLKNIFDHEKAIKVENSASKPQQDTQAELTALKNDKQLVENNARITLLVTGGIILLLLFIIGATFIFLRLKSRHLKELNRKNQELSQINQSLDQFVSIASHDLKAPIASCRGIIDILREQEDISTFREYLDLQEMSLNKLEYLIRDLLDYSRSNRADIHLSKINLNAKIEEIQQNLQFYKAARKVEFTYICSNDSILYSDDLRLRIILSNLVSNSIRYKSLTAPDPYVKIEAEIDQQKALIKVIDNGQGIPAEYHEHVFDMFFKVSKNHKSTGLGLYIVKEAVKKLNGKIWFDSKENIGTTFYVEIPNLASHVSKLNKENELTEIR
ncbi:MAG: sensor histidine kinase [Cyclobacteriaceae bacterium]